MRTGILFAGDVRRSGVHVRVQKSFRAEKVAGSHDRGKSKRAAKAWRAAGTAIAKLLAARSGHRRVQCSITMDQRMAAVGAKLPFIPKNDSAAVQLPHHRQQLEHRYPISFHNVTSYSLAVVRPLANPM